MAHTRQCLAAGEARTHSPIHMQSGLVHLIQTGAEQARVRAAAAMLEAWGAVTTGAPEAKGADALKVVILPEFASCEPLNSYPEVVLLDTAPVVRDLRQGEQ